MTLVPFRSYSAVASKELKMVLMHNQCPIFRGSVLPANIVLGFVQGKLTK